MSNNPVYRLNLLEIRIDGLLETERKRHTELQIEHQDKLSLIDACISSASLYFRSSHKQIRTYQRQLNRISGRVKSLRVQKYRLAIKLQNVVIAIHKLLQIIDLHDQELEKRLLYFSQRNAARFSVFSNHIQLFGDVYASTLKLAKNEILTFNGVLNYTPQVPMIAATVPVSFVTTPIVSDIVPQEIPETNSINPNPATETVITPAAPLIESSATPALEVSVQPNTETITTPSVQSTQSNNSSNLNGTSASTLQTETGAINGSVNPVQPTSSSTTNQSIPSSVSVNPINGVDSGYNPGALYNPPLSSFNPFNPQNQNPNTTIPIPQNNQTAAAPASSSSSDPGFLSGLLNFMNPSTSSLVDIALAAGVGGIIGSRNNVSNSVVPISLQGNSSVTPKKSDEEVVETTVAPEKIETETETITAVDIGSKISKKNNNKKTIGMEKEIIKPVLPTSNDNIIDLNNEDNILKEMEMFAPQPMNPDIEITDLVKPDIVQKVNSSSQVIDHDNINPNPLPPYIETIVNDPEVLGNHIYVSNRKSEKEIDSDYSHIDDMFYINSIANDEDEIATLSSNYQKPEIDENLKAVSSDDLSGRMKNLDQVMESLNSSSLQLLKRLHHSSVKKYNI